MKIKVKEKKNNPLMKRKEIEAIVEHSKEATPSKAAVQLLLSKQLKTKPTKLEIDKILNLEGTHKSRVLCKLWQKEKVRDLSKKVEEKGKSKEESENIKRERESSGKEKPKAKTSQQKTSGK